MSVPARKLPLDPAPRPAPRSRPAPPARSPAARPRPSTPPQSRRTARRGHHPAFWLFGAAVLSVMIVGFVAVNALLVQTTYQMQAVRRQVQDLADQQIVLTNDAATLSSPERVAEWARTTGFVVPEPGATVILRVPGVKAADGRG